MSAHRRTAVGNCWRSLPLHRAVPSPVAGATLVVTALAAADEYEIPTALLLLVLATALCFLLRHFVGASKISERRFMKENIWIIFHSRN
jgi:hypothetical protein